MAAGGWKRDLDDAFDDGREHSGQYLEHNGFYKIYIYYLRVYIYFNVEYYSGVYFKNLPSSTTAPLLQALLSNIFPVFFVLLPRPNSNRVNESTNQRTYQHRHGG